MKTDNYTKFVLTVIAMALTANLFIRAEVLPNMPLNDDGSMNVKVTSMPETIDVNINEVGGYSTYGKVPVEVESGKLDIDQIDGQVHVWVDNK